VTAHPIGARRRSAAQEIRARAPAKVNLFLHIGDKRPDGFHALESLVVFVEEGDVLTATPADALSLHVTGPFARALEGTENLVLKAARALAPERGAAITLEKHLPVAAGLGGGSADAAAALRVLNELWGLARSEKELVELAAEIGSDVPACVLSRPVWMEGRGERLLPVAPFPPLSLVLVNPRVMLSTRAVFATLNLRNGVGAARPPHIHDVWELVSYLADSENDLEAPASRLAPVINEVLEAIAHEPGCVLAQMSGSGATCFGLFQDGPWADGAAERIAEDHPGWWVRATKVAPSEFGAPQSS
jgi:4-diphosphocytidyl-2-C-methyl-D-erythritol kinase